jgi:hypothetical protein
MQIFSVSIFKTIMIKLIYKDKYDIVDERMPDSNFEEEKEHPKPYFCSDL